MNRLLEAAKAIVAAALPILAEALVGIFDDWKTAAASGAVVGAGVYVTPNRQD